MNGLLELGAWMWANVQMTNNVKMGVRLKPNAVGVIQRFKARICARGDQTKEGYHHHTQI